MPPSFFFFFSRRGGEAAITHCRWLLSQTHRSDILRGREAGEGGEEVEEGGGCGGNESGEMIVMVWMQSSAQTYKY